MKNTTLLSALVVSFAVSCGGSQPSPATADPAPSEDPTESAPTPDAQAGPTEWKDDLSKEDKGAFMKSHVMPKMKEVFQSMSAERYADFGCATCHGAEWKDHPRDALPALKMKDGKFDVPPEKAPVVEFMMKKVTPEMAGLFGKPPYNPETNEGFGCAGCHTVEM